MLYPTELPGLGRHDIPPRHQNTTAEPPPPQSTAHSLNFRIIACNASDLLDN